MLTLNHLVQLVSREDHVGTLHDHHTSISFGGYAAYHLLAESSFMFPDDPIGQGTELN